MQPIDHPLILHPLDGVFLPRGHTAARWCDGGRREHHDRYRWRGLRWGGRREYLRRLERDLGPPRHAPRRSWSTRLAPAKVWSLDSSPLAGSRGSRGPALLRLPAVFKLKASEARVPCASRGAPCVLSTDNPPDRRLEVMRGAGWARASNLRDLYGWRWACTPSVQGGEARDRYPAPKPKLLW